MSSQMPDIIQTHKKTALWITEKKREESDKSYTYRRACYPHHCNCLAVVISGHISNPSIVIKMVARVPSCSYDKYHSSILYRKLSRADHMVVIKQMMWPPRNNRHPFWVFLVSSAIWDGATSPISGGRRLVRLENDH